MRPTESYFATRAVHAGREDFAALVKEFSEDMGSKERGGEYVFPRGKMVPEFESVAFTLMPGQISEVVTSQFGYHIIKVIEKLAPKTIPPDHLQACEDLGEALATGLALGVF